MDSSIHHKDLILITGANGFIGSRVVNSLLEQGFTNLRCFVRPAGRRQELEKVLSTHPNASVELIEGNLLSPEDCKQAAAGVHVVFHIAAGIEKSFAGSYLNSVVTTRNLLEAIVQAKAIKRFLNVSSFAVYSNMHIKPGGLLDETCETEPYPLERHEPYVYSKAKQDEIVMEYANKFNIPYVIVRPGVVYGPGNRSISARVGIGTFGIFLHLGGRNRIPLTYVDNCAKAMVLAGTVQGVDGEIFNIVDDELPRSRDFLKMIKKNVREFRSLSLPYPLFFLLCWFWETYSDWSGGQLLPVFNRRRCAAYWKGNRYTNEKLKKLLAWKPEVPFADASARYFEYLKKAGFGDA